jgi:hypothetical protein
LSLKASGVKSFNLIPSMRHQVAHGETDMASAVEARRGERSEPANGGAASVTSGSTDGGRPTRAVLSDEGLAALKRRAGEALAADGVGRTRLGYDVLVKLKMDDLLEQACVQILASADGAHPPAEVTARC